LAFVPNALSNVEQMRRQSMDLNDHKNSSPTVHCHITSNNLPIVLHDSAAREYDILLFVAENP
jgi:hypothetical protein